VEENEEVSVEEYFKFKTNFNFETSSFLVKYWWRHPEIKNMFLYNHDHYHDMLQ